MVNITRRNIENILLIIFWPLIKIQQIEDMIVIAPEHVPVFMPDDLVKPIKLSVAMMMRDEEKHIAKVLESVKDIADEIIIVDTGSTDKSIKIAKSFGPKIKFIIILGKMIFHCIEIRALVIVLVIGY